MEVVPGVCLSYWGAGTNKEPKTCVGLLYVLLLLGCNPGIAFLSSTGTFLVRNTSLDPSLMKDPST